MRVNPVAIVFIAFCTAVGALVDHALLGLAVGLGVVLLATILPE